MSIVGFSLLLLMEFCPCLLDSLYKFSKIVELNALCQLSFARGSGRT